MKLIVTVTILVVCLTPISASFFDEFRGAIVSVHQSFGRLFSDVVTDVSDTIGCTILAVKQVLALDGSYHESSDYDRRCKDRAPAPNTAYPLPTNDKSEKALVDVNEHNAQEEITNIEFELKKQTDRLMAISNLLKRELDNIPNDIRIQFKTTDPDPNESTVGHIWRDLKILHGIEHSQDKIPQINEIHEVLDEALQIMQINDTNLNVSDDEKIKKIVIGLEKETNDTIIDVEDQFSKWEEEDREEEHKVNTLTEVKEENSIEKGGNAKETDRINDIAKVETQLEKWENEEQIKSREVLKTISEVDNKFTEWSSEEEKRNNEIKSAVTDEMPKNDLPSIVKNDAIIIYAENENASNNEPVTTTTVTPSTSTQTTSTQTTSAPTTTTQTTSIPTTTTQTTSTSTTSTPTTSTPTTSTPTTSTPTTSTQDAITSTTTESELEEFQAYVLSQLGPQDAESKAEAVSTAEKIVADSEYRNKIFNYLKSTEDSGANLFENPELFNFGS